MCSMTASIALILTCALGAGAHGSTGQRQSQPPRRPSPAQEAMERARKDQDQVRDLSAKLKEALLELNRLKQVPPSDPQYKAVPDLIARQSAVVLQLASAIYSIVQGNGLASAVLDQRQSLQGLMTNGLPARERQELADAGFTPTDIAELSVTIQLHGMETLNRLNPVEQKKQLETAVGGAARARIATVLKIGGGALLIGLDVGSRFI